MTSPLAERLFGIAFKPEPARSVRDLVRKVRTASGQIGKIAISRRDDTVADAQALFENADLHHLPVLEGTRLVGIVSTMDLLRFFSHGDASAAPTTRLGEVMTSNPEVISETAPIGELVRRLAQAPFRCLPVVDDDLNFVDIVTTRDLVRFLEATMH
jgi:CBS domain-containing protein